MQARCARQHARSACAPARLIAAWLWAVSAQGTVVWRARVPLSEPLDHLCWFFGADKVGFLYPISKACMVWTFSAPVRCRASDSLRLLSSSSAANTHNADNVNAACCGHVKASMHACVWGSRHVMWMQLHVMTLRAEGGIGRCVAWLMCQTRLVEEAGVEFDPADGGHLRASTQAVAGTNRNALEVRTRRLFLLNLLMALTCSWSRTCALSTSASALSPA